jgi:hypothetical protein
MVVVTVTEVEEVWQNPAMEQVELLALGYEARRPGGRTEPVVKAVLEDETQFELMLHAVPW